MSDDNKKKDIDKVTGVETTGHEWDGLKELNNPLPRWWLWVLYATIVWAIGYWVVYPAWPTLSGHTKGSGGYTQFSELKDSQAEIIARQQTYLNRFEDASYSEILNDPELYAFAIAGGRSAFKDNCATCHGTGGAGGKGYPNLNDDDWLWGGTLQDIHQTLDYGIRVAGSYDTRQSQMPAFGKDGLLKRDEINAVVGYVMNLSGAKDDHGHGNAHHGNKKPMADYSAMGAEIFQKQCASCHGENGKGLKEFGAPNLTDKIWLYGGDRGSIYETIFYSRAGMMPAWKERLGDNTIKQLTIYLHQLGGGVEPLDE